MSQTPITITGHLTADPELVLLPSGVYKTNLRLASSRRYPVTDDNGHTEWKEVDSVFVNVEAWETLALNVKHCLFKGMPVIVVGSLNSSSYDAEGGRRTRYAIRASFVGLDLNRYIVAARKMEFNQVPPGMTLPEDKMPEPDRVIGEDTPEDTAADLQAAQSEY